LTIKPYEKVRGPQWMSLNGRSAVTNIRSTRKPVSSSALSIVLGMACVRMEEEEEEVVVVAAAVKAVAEVNMTVAGL